MNVDIWAVLSVIIMIVAGFVSFIPMVPGPALVWAIALIYAAATEFQVVGVGTVIGITLLMIIGSTADWWTRLFGLQADSKLTCGTFTATTLGAILGTFFIPIPILGTLIGAGLGVMAIVLYQESDWQKAFKAARGIMAAWLASFFVEFVISLTIVLIFVYTVLPL